MAISILAFTGIIIVVYVAPLYLIHVPVNPNQLELHTERRVSHWQDLWFFQFN